MTDDTRRVSREKTAAWARLIRVSQSVLGAVEAELKSKGFPPLAWYDALLELRRAMPEGLRPFELQNEMLLAQYNLSRLTDRLVRAGYIARLPCTDDARGFVLKITPEGNDLLTEMWPVYRSAIERHFATRIDDNDARNLTEILGRLLPQATR